jgi:transcriptional regulator with XRE-family HTH domain
MFGNNLKKIIEDRGIKQSHLARKLGVSRQRMYQITRSARVSDRIAEALARELNVDVEVLNASVDSQQPV